MSKSRLNCRYIVLGLFVFALFGQLKPYPSVAQVVEPEIQIFSISINRGTNSATINWTTNPATKGRLEYADTDGIWQETPWSDTYREKHSITLLYLKSNATYLYRISAENVDGEVKTKTSNFTTVDSDIVGQNPGATDSVSGGFKSLLEPSSSPSPTPAPNVLGQQNLQYLPYYPIPIAIPYQPIQGTSLEYTAVDPNTPVNPNPTPIITATANDKDESGIRIDPFTFIIGITLGIGGAFFFHYFTDSQTLKAKKQLAARHSSQTQPKKMPKPKPAVYSFKVNPD